MALVPSLVEHEICQHTVGRHIVDFKTKRHSSEAGSIELGFFCAALQTGEHNNVFCPVLLDLPSAPAGDSGKGLSHPELESTCYVSKSCKKKPATLKLPPNFNDDSVKYDKCDTGVT